MDDIELGRVAVRTFALDYGLEKFHSLAAPGDHWSTGSCSAVCIGNVTSVGHSNGIDKKGKVRHDHLAPNLVCTCGIYGALYLDTLTRQFHALTGQTLAVIAAEGVTLIGSRGLRTQYARVLGYWLGDYGTFDFKVRDIAARQFVNARSYEDPIALIRAFGIPLMAPGNLALQRGGGGAGWWTSEEKEFRL
jgi:hypothetical protein